MRSAICSILVLTLAGCAGTPAARNLSRETLAQVIEYEQQIRTLSRDLQNNYKQSAVDYDLNLSRAQETSETRILVNAANDAADKAIRKGYSDKDVRDFAEGILQSNKAT